MEMQKKYNNEETDNVNIYESKIIQILSDTKNNLEFVVDWLEGDFVKLLFEGVSNIVFDLSRNPIYGDELLTSLEIRGFSYKWAENFYDIQFNFDTDFLGTIGFKCRNFSFYVPSPPLTVGGNDYMLNEIV